MTSPGITGKLARAAATRPWLFLAAWLLLLGMSAYLATGLGSVIDDEAASAVVTESERADALIDENFDDQEPPGEVLIVESETQDFKSPEFRSVVQDLVARLARVDTVDSVTSPLDGGSQLVSNDGQIALITFSLVPVGDEQDPIEPVIEMVEGRQTSDYRITLFGSASIGAEIDRLAEETLVRGEAVGLIIALVIMIAVFGTLVAAGIPIVLSIAAIVVAVALTTLVGQLFPMSSVVLNMITMIGLAVGIDYGLFILYRFREERHGGAPVVDSVARAGDSAGRAVLFSGVTVVVALSGLLIVPDGTIRAVGIGAICAVFGAILAALTLLPAMLSLLGDKVEKGSLPFRHRRSGQIWSRISSTVMRRPLVFALASGALLVAMALPYLSINLGSNFVDSLPDDSSSRHGVTIMTAHFGLGSSTTAVVVEASNVTTGPVAESIGALDAALGASGRYGTSDVRVSEDGRVALIQLPDLVDPSSDEGRAALHTLRAELVPELFSDNGASVLVTGEAAGTADFVTIVENRFPIVVGVVLALSFLLLLVAFRSIVVPIKAIVMNLLSVGAAYGMLVLVFQNGLGAEVFGFQTSDVIESWIPLFLFTVLFGLSMDYHIFLLSRIKEHHDVYGDNRASVTFGLRSTGALITGAALIMVAVFGGFASGDLVMLQQLGFGLAVAVIIDATVVRSILVPATMALLGERNWYLPSWLGWLPKFEIEGTSETTGQTVLVGTHTGGI